MGKRFHVAMFCSVAAFDERRAFYSSTFGAPSYDGGINEGAESHTYAGSIWNRQDGVVFALLVNQSLTGPFEQLAHVGYIFDNEGEYDAEIQRREIDPGKIKMLREGQKQVFATDASGVEWEFSLDATSS